MSELRLSFSSISTFKQCPKRWEYKYIDGLVDPGSYATVMGKFVHSVFEDFYTLAGTERSVDAAKQIARQQWEVYSADEEFLQFVPQDEASLKKFRQVAWGHISSVWEFEDPTEVDVVENELEFNIDIEGTKVRGFIDRIERKDNKLIVIDYKTGSAPAKRYEQDKLGQLYLYGVAVESELSERAALGKLYYTGQQIITAPLTKGRTDLARREVAETAVKINKAKGDSFKENPGPLCGWCSFIDRCEAGQQFLIERHREGRLKTKAPAYGLIKDLAAQ